MPNWDDFEAVEPDWEQFTLVSEPSQASEPDWSQFERVPSIPGSIPATPPPPIPMPEPIGRSLNEALAEFPKDELRAVTKAGLESEKRLAAAQGNLAGALATGIEKAEAPIVPPEVMRLGIAGGAPLPPRAEGVVQSVAEIGSSFTSPINLGLAAVTGGASAAAVPGSVLRQAIPRGVALGFGGEMLRHTPENLERYRAVIEDPNSTEQEKTKAAADLLLQTGLGVGITGSGLAKLPKTAPRGEVVPEGTPGSPIIVPEVLTPETQSESSLPDWAREEMRSRGLDPKRPLNDVDLQNASVVDAIKSDPTLTPEQKQRILKSGSLTPETVVAPETKGVTDAIKDTQAAEVYGDVRQEPIESQRQVPTEESRGGVQAPRPEAQTGEVLLKEGGTIAKEETLDLGNGFTAQILDYSDGASVSYLDSSGMGVGNLEVIQLPNGVRAVENHAIFSEGRGRGMGQKVIEHFAERYGEIWSDEHPSADAVKMWERLGATKRRVDVGGDMQYRYVLERKAPTTPTPAAAAPEVAVAGPETVAGPESIPKAYTVRSLPRFDDVAFRELFKDQNADKIQKAITQEARQALESEFKSAMQAEQSRVEQQRTEVAKQNAVEFLKSPQTVLEALSEEGGRSFDVGEMLIFKGIAEVSSKRGKGKGVLRHKGTIAEGIVSPRVIRVKIGDKIKEVELGVRNNRKDIEEAEASAAQQFAREIAGEAILKQPTTAGRVLIGKSPQPEPAPELIGMGGAVPGEFAPTSKTATGIKNATVDAERAARGLPPAIEPTRRAFGEVWDRAMAAIDRDPLIQDRLVKELSEKARALTDAEDALLLHRQIELQNEYGKATRDLAQAFDDGRTDDVRIEQQRVDALSDQLLELYEVGKAAGTETGRGLAARKMMANEDFTLAKMEVEKRAAKGGKPLTESERAELVRLQNKITETQKAYDDYVASNAEKLAERESLRAFSEMQAKAAAEAPSQYVLQVAERIVTHLEQRATDARTRLREKLSRVGTSPDPTIILDLAELGAAHIARAGLDFAKWSTEMVREFGDKVSPMLEEAWKKSRELVDATAERFTERKAATPRVKRVVTKDAETRRAALVEGLKENISQGGTLADGRRFVQQLAEGFVASGIKERNPLIDAVHGVLKGIVPEITRRETMDLISGYGDFKPLNPDQIKAQLRDLKGQMQQVSKLEDIQAKKPLQKTGVERRSPSDEERRLIQQVNEAKKRHGVVVTDPARQLKSALDAVKTRLRNQISDLNYQIATRQKTVRQKSAPPSDAEVAKLTAERDALRSQFTEIFGKPELTPEQRLKIAERAADRAIERLEADLDAGRLKPQPKTSKTPESAGLLEKRAWLQALREHRKELLDLAEPKKTPEEIALQSLKTRLTSSIAEYQRRLKEGDFEPRKRRELDISKDPDAMRLKAQNEKWKEEYQRGLLMDRMKRRSTGQKVYAGVKEALNLPRTVLASWDLSAVLRQGGFITFGHPARALNAMRDMFKALASEDAARTANTAIANWPNAPLYKRSKLYIAPLDALRLTAQEEAIMSRLADRIPGVKHSNRAYITFLNRIRADSFDAMVRSVERKGSPIKPEELDAIANYINVATGRGSLGKAAAAAETLATVFFSPRLVASRFQLLAGQPLYRGTARTRKLIAQEYGRTLLGLSVIYGLAQLAGAEVELDPRSSDFRKLKFGETRIDPLMGLAQITVLLSRLTTGEKVTLSGRLQSIRGDVPFGGQDASDVLKQFARTKLSPVVGAGVDIATGTNVIGEEVTPVSVATNMLIPLSLKDIYNVMVEHGIPAGTAITILSLFGMGVQHYE